MSLVTTLRVPLGTSGIEIFPLVLGGNVLGWTADRDASFAILDRFVDAGGNLVDSADSYTAWIPGHRGGESERVIGEWIKARGSGHGLLVATKVSKHPEFLGLAPENIRRAADASLSRLGVDVIDLYFAHFDDPSVPIADTVGAFSELVDAGKVRSIGVSNYSAERIDEWFAATEAGGYHRAVALQPHYNLVERTFEADLRARAERYGLGVLPYFGLAKGFLTGKYRAGGPAVDSPRAKAAAGYLDERGGRVLAALDEIAADHGVDPASVALAWLREQPTVAAPIASARTTEQLEPLLASAVLDITPAEVARLTDASA